MVALTFHGVRDVRVGETNPPVVREPADVTDVFSHTLLLADGSRAYEMFDRKHDGCIKVALVP